jgi:hypothetical protein
VSARDFQEALAALLGKDAPNLSPAVISRLLWIRQLRKEMHSNFSGLQCISF